MLVPKSVVRSKKEREREREREYMSRFPTFILSSCEDFVNGKSTVMQQAECLRYQPSPDNPDQIPQWACRIQELCRSKTPKSLISSSMKHRSIPNSFQFIPRHRGFSENSVPQLPLLWNWPTPGDPARTQDLPCHRLFVVSDPLQALLHQLQGAVAGAQREVLGAQLRQDLAPGMGCGEGGKKEDHGGSGRWEKLTICEGLWLMNDMNGLMKPKMFQWIMI